MKYTKAMLTERYVGNQVKVLLSGNDSPYIGRLMLNAPEYHTDQRFPFYLVVLKGNNVVFGPSHVKKIEIDNTDYLGIKAQEEIQFELTPKERYQKMLQIEKDLGIDLMIRHKVETCESLYYKNDKGRVVDCWYYCTRGKEGVILLVRGEDVPVLNEIKCPWSDYGKTWSLNKGDLL